MENLGKMILMTGLGLVVLGGLLWVFGRSGGSFLPGDIVVERKGFRFYFPIVTCLVISLVLSLVAGLTRR